MRLKDTALIDTINPTFIARTATAIHHCLSAWNTGQFRLPPEFGPGGGAQRQRDTRNINHAVNSACTDGLCPLDADFRSSSPEVPATKIGDIRSIIRHRIHSAGTGPAIAQPHNNQGSSDKFFLHYVPEELIEQPHNSFNHLSSFVAATEASILFPAVLPMGRSVITSSSQPIPCSNSNSHSNSNDNTNMTSLDNTGLVNGSTIVEGAMSHGG
jgi:hypothetical protein